MFERHIQSGAFSVFSVPLGPERKDCEDDVSPASNRQDPVRVFSTAADVEQMGGGVPAGPCGSGAECETPTVICSTKRANQPTRSAPSASHEMGMGTNIAVARSVNRLDGSVEALEPRDWGVDGINYETVDDGIAAADWLDVTHSMLGAMDELMFASR